MPPKNAPAAEAAWEWPFDEVRVRLEDGTWAIRKRPEGAVAPTDTNTDEETP